MNAYLHRLRLQRGLAFGVIIVAALLAFEIFNYSTTDFALSDLLGDLRFMGVSWATILSIAFCGIDFAGIARLFTPEEGADEPGEVWYLFGAWLLAATMNAMLTWWGVSLAILNHQTLGNAVIDRSILLRIVPIFVAVLVWLIRVLIIGTFSVAGDRLFSQSDQYAQPVAKRRQIQHASHSALPAQTMSNRPPVRTSVPPRPAYKPAPKTPSANRPESQERPERPEPTYHPEPSYQPMSASGRSKPGMKARSLNQSNHSRR